MANRKSKTNTEWSNDFAYVIGIIATDGNLSSDLRHLNITSKDYEMLINCKKCLGIDNKIGTKSRDTSKKKNYYALQWGDTNFFEYLLSIGLTPRKSKTLGKLDIPTKYFPHFLRGCIDGDGSIYMSTHPESKHLQCQMKLYSASNLFLDWILECCRKSFSVAGGSISKTPSSSVYSLKFCKSDSIKILGRIYSKDVVCLSRKMKSAQEIINIGRVV